MQHPKPVKVAAAVAAALALTAGSQAMANEAVMYTSNNVQVIDTATDVGKKLTPGLTIQKVTAGTGALMKRIEAEAARPLGDVVWGAGFGTMVAFKQNFQPYKSSQADKILAQFHGPDNLWIGANAHVMVVMANEGQLKGDKPPVTWKDLFDSKWKGRIIMGDPATSGSAYDQVYGIYQLYGSEGLEKLAANAVISKSSGQVYKSVASGEYPLGITMEYAAYSYIAGGQKNVKIIYPQEGAFVAPEAVAVIKNPKNGAASAQQLYDLLISKEVQEAELVQNFRRPTRSDIDVAALTQLPNLSSIQVVAADPIKAAADYPVVIEAWKAAVQKARQ